MQRFLIRKPSSLVFLLLFLPILMASFLFAPTFATDHSVTISTSGDVEISVEPNKSTVESSDINVITTCKAGYNLALSTSGNDNKLYLSGDSSNNGINTHFDPSDGQTILNDASNTWGYSLDIPSSNNPSVLTSPTISNVFLPVPTINNAPATLKTAAETASDTAETTINDEFSIYYGVNASNSLISGAYYIKNDEGTNDPGKIVYYVTMNPICAIELDLSFNENLDGAGGEGTDNTIVNFPTMSDNTADLAHNTVTLTSKVPARDGYAFTGWNTEPDGTGTTYQPGDTIRVGDGANELTGTVTLYAIWEVGQAYVVTLDFDDDDIKNIEFYHDTLNTQYVNEDGGIVVMRANQNYYFIINYENGYATDTITSTANGTIGNTTVRGITYTVTGDSTLTITSQEKTGVTTLDVGMNLNTKIKTLAEGTNTSSSANSSKIKALRMASFLPTDFVASTSNTVSISNSAKPVYIFFDNTNDAGIMYFYTEARDVYMNADSSMAFFNNIALVDISALASWNTSNVTNMSNMFSSAYSLADISPLSGWNTSSVTNVLGMFQNAYSLTGISALANWNTSSVTNMSYMFQNAYSLTNVPALANWNTSNVTNMSYMFQNAYSLTNVSALTNWNTSNVTNMSHMFQNAYSLADISALAGWNTGNVTSMSYMFSSAYSLADISALTNWNTSKVIDMSHLFSYTHTLTDISPLTNWRTDSVTDMSHLFHENYSLTDISALTSWNTSSVTNMSYIFYYAHSLTDISALTSWNTSSVTNMSYMFAYAYSLADISPLAGWNTGDVKNMSYMFTYAYSLTDLSPIANWNTSSVTDMSYMFRYAYSLTDVSAIDNWDITAVTATAGSSSSSSNKFIYMFYQALSHPNFTKRLGTWDTNGTFIPSSGTAVTVTVGLDDHIKGVSFYDSTYGTRTVTEDGDTIVIPSGVTQDISVLGYDDGYTFNVWSNTNSTIGSVNSNPTTFSASTDAALSVTSTSASTSTVTISPDAHFDSIIIKSSNYETKTITSSDISNNNNTVSLVNNVAYDIVINYENGYKKGTVSTTANGTIGNATARGITYTVTGNDTLTIASLQKSGSASLDTGQNLNQKIKSLANTTSSKIKALRMASFLPTGFTASTSNTVSTSGSAKPVYIFFDSTNDAGIMYFYTEASDVYMNANSFYAFYSNAALTDISALANWNTSSVTNMSYMFYNAYSLTDISALANWDTSSVTNMSYMFYNAYSLTNTTALANWNTGGVTNMSYMFYNTYSLTDVSAPTNWNTSSVTNMSYMFYNAHSLTDISALANWNTGSVTNMSYMFYSAYSLTNISALANWNTGSVTNMGSTFNNTYSLSDISALANWNTGRVTTMSSMFKNTYSLTDVSSLANWNLGKVTNMSNMFQFAYSLTNISALASWNTSSVLTMDNMFYYAYSLTDISPLANWNTSKVKDMSYMFRQALSITNVSAINNWDIRAVTATAGDSSLSNKFYMMFYGALSHPNFTMRAGTWDANGTFIPSS